MTKQENNPNTANSPLEGGFRGALNIYRASAGSGKTYKLTENYLKLLFENDKQAHRNILAVTFTNKATDEMKSRILLELDKLASGEKSDHLEALQKPKSNKFSKSVRFTEEEIREKAKNILIGILHDYSRFSVSTIDKFFQQVIRSFTREIGLQGGYNVELDQNKILSAAIDKMMYDLDKKENKELLKWLTKFSEEKIEQGGNWNIKRDIENLAKEIFTEEYKNFSSEIYEKLQDKKFMKNYRNELNEIKQEFETTLKALAENAISIITSNGLQTTDFPYGKNSGFNTLNKLKAGNFEEELGKRFSDLPNNLNNWSSKSTPANIVSLIENAYNNGLNKCIDEIVNFHTQHIMQYLSIKYITQNIYTLGILADIDKQVKIYQEEKNTMLLSDSNSLLNKIIDDNDTPFVYEKTGAYIEHFMIDEFQDTSSMQWANFRPLVKNSLAQKNENLIVGDVKQSIYRWRNSDWTLLDSQLEKDFRHEKIRQEVLDTNWRSKKNIVDFNNAFFTISSKILQNELNNDLPEQAADTGFAESISTKITDAYKKLYQNIPPNKISKGQVRFEFIENEKGDEVKWKDKALQKLPETLEKLQDNGFQLKDIAILVRTKDEGKTAANFLLEYKENQTNTKYKYDVISDEALLISNSASVKFILSLLCFFINSDDKINETITAFEYLTNIKQSPAGEALKDYFSSKNQSLLTAIFDKKTIKNIEKIKHLPLFEMVEEIISLFKLGEKENESIFLQAFQDTVFDFVSNNNADIDNFLKWWETSGYNKSISTPQGQNAIKIMTIHKSKGLDFEAVIIPFCDWNLDQKAGNILWCEPQIEPYNQLNIIPIPYTSKLSNTIFYKDYITEKMHSYIDNLNVAYVAFTRAKSELFAFAPKPNEKSIKSLAGLMHFCFENSSNFPTKTEEEQQLINLSENWTKEKNIFQSGDFEHLEKKEDKKATEEIKLQKYISEENNERLKLRMHSSDYFTEKDTKINYGTVMHEILNNVQTIQDIDKAVEQTVLAGKITKEQSIEIKEKLLNFISKPRVNEWFTDKYKILNEATIITPQSDIYRPDRVLIKDKEAIVIDYKFGEKEENKYTKQLQNYMHLIENMNYSTSGFICYVELGKIVEVK
jgi:ATP-dependent exoDNAse (exonuclease V) beta subunit